VATVCKRCKQPILWALTANGRPMPLDAEPDPKGNVKLSEQRGTTPRAAVLGGTARDEAAERGEQLYMPHHATCAFAKEFRR
jgi:hypothetical protein